MNEEKIQQAVKTCVASAIGSDRPFRAVGDFLLMLRSSKWEDNEILEVQTRVLSKLREIRQGGKQ